MFLYLSLVGLDESQWKKTSFFFFFKQLYFLCHLWSRRSNGSSSCARSMLNNGATALDPLTPSASARHGNDKNKQKHKRRKQQDVPGVLSGGGAELGPVSTTLLELCLPSNATQRHRSHARLFCRAPEDCERAAVDKLRGGIMTKRGQQRRKSGKTATADICSCGPTKRRHNLWNRVGCPGDAVRT